MCIYAVGLGLGIGLLCRKRIPLFRLHSATPSDYGQVTIWRTLLTCFKVLHLFVWRHQCLDEFFRTQYTVNPIHVHLSGFEGTDVCSFQKFCHCLLRFAEGTQFLHTLCAKLSPCQCLRRGLTSGNISQFRSCGYDRRGFDSCSCHDNTRFDLYPRKGFS